MEDVPETLPRVAASWRIVVVLVGAGAACPPWVGLFWDEDDDAAETLVSDDPPAGAADEVLPLAALRFEESEDGLADEAFPLEAGALEDEPDDGAAEAPWAVPLGDELPAPEEVDDGPDDAGAADPPCTGAPEVLPPVDDPEPEGLFGDGFAGPAFEAACAEAVLPDAEGAEDPP